MSKVTLLAYAEKKLAEAKQNLKFAVQDFSTPDETILELREAVRSAEAEVQRLVKKGRGLLGFLGL
jgi:ribosomal protein L13E